MKFLLIFFTLLYSFSISATELSLSHNGEYIELHLVYNDDNNIRLYIDYIEATTPTNVIYFWLNDGKLVQKYISFTCDETTYKNKKYAFTLTKEQYDLIAYDCHSISIGNKWKIVKHKNIHIVQRYFVEQQLAYKNKLYQDVESKHQILQKEIERLEGLIKNLKIANEYYVRELKESREKLQCVTDSLNVITYHNQSKSTAHTPSYTYERTTPSERVYNRSPYKKYTYKYYRNGKWRYYYQK